MSRSIGRSVRPKLMFGFAAALAVSATLLSFAAPAAASSSISVRMTFTEQEFSPKCALPDGFCGTGVVLPFGKATETIRFEAGCGGGCDFRTIDLPQGSIFIEEPFNTAVCPSGTCAPAGAGEPVYATLSDTVVGGTGIFAGASGHLDGSVRAAGDASLIQLSGTIVLP
jgi:hypothetical protein